MTQCPDASGREPETAPPAGVSRIRITLVAVGVIAALVLAISGWLLDTQYHNLWAVVTIAVSYLHYAYDGIIWKARPPAKKA